MEQTQTQTWIIPTQMLTVFIEPFHQVRVPTIRNGASAAARHPIKHTYTPVLLTAQLFGVLPTLAGLRASTVDRVRSCWLHWSLVLYGLVTADALVELTLCLSANLSDGLTLNSSAEIIFLAANLYANKQFVRIARRWPAIVQHWHRAESTFGRPPYRRCRPLLRIRLRMIGFGMLFVALVEHSLYAAAAVYKNWLQIVECRLLDVEFFENLFRTERAHVFHYLPYSHWLAVPGEYANVAITFSWSFVDVFIAVLSAALSARFGQFNDRLQSIMAEVGVRMLPDDAMWSTMRIDYNTLSELVAYVDEQVSSLVVISCLSNMYFVCFLLFNSVK